MGKKKEKEKKKARSRKTFFPLTPTTCSVAGEIKNNSPCCFVIKQEQRFIFFPQILFFLFFFFFIAVVILPACRPIAGQQDFRGEGSCGGQSHFKGKASPFLPPSPSLPRSPGCVPYITPSVPGCELRRLVSILHRRAHRRNAACLPICFCLRISLFLFICLFVFFGLPSILKKKHGQSPSMRGETMLWKGVFG